MICIKTGIARMPDDCADCVWFGTKPHPVKGWTDQCELMYECMDDDACDEWQWGGDGRPKACPLVEVDGERKDDDDRGNG